MIGTELLNFRILEQLGEGGMGVVYKGIDTSLDRIVAIKVLSSDLSRNPDLVERFRSEARAQANLNHTNIATLYAFVAHAGQAWMVMEYIEGETISQMLERRGLLPPDVAVPLFKQALLGIGWAHRMGIVHRDIKPSNLMVNKQGIVKVMDFGIAKVLGGGRGLTRTGTALGTAYYMSPEQVMNQSIDFRSDIYSLGVTLYEMLTANLPFQGESDFQIMTAHVHAPPVPPTRHYPYIPRGIENAVLKAMLKNANARFQTVEEFGAALEHPDDFGVTWGVAAPQPPAMAPPPPPPPPSTPPPFTPPPSTPPPGLATRPAPTPPAGRPIVDQTAATAPLTPVAQQMAAAPPRPPDVQRPVTPPPLPPPPVQPGPPNNSMGMKLVAGIAALALLGGGGFYGFKKYQDERKKKQEIQAGGNTDTVIHNEKKETKEVNVWPPAPPADGSTELKIVAFDADARRVQPGQTANLRWSVQGASRVTITPDIGDVDPSGTKEVAVRRTTQFQLKATKLLSGEEVHQTVTIEVGTAGPPPVKRLEVALEAQPESIVAGQTARLQWSVPGAEEVVITPDVGRVRPSGATVVKPNDTTTYSLQARAGNATGAREVTVQVQQPPKPAPVKPEISFQAAPASIPAGGAATLSWTLQGAVAANIAPEPGTLHQTSGRARVTPATTTTYVLTARSKDGITDTATATVQVTPAGPGPAPGPERSSGQVRGGSTSLITVVHDHAGTLNATTWPSCYGALQVTNGVLRYAVAGTVDGRKDGFEIPISQVQDVAMNRVRIKNQPAFHIVIRGQHFNFVSTGMAPGQAVAELKTAMAQR